MTEWFGVKAEIKEDGLCYFENGSVIDPAQYVGIGCSKDGSPVNIDPFSCSPIFNSHLIAFDDGIDPPAESLHPPEIDRTGKSRRCVVCNNMHDTIVQDMKTGEALKELDKCRNCIMNGIIFNPITEQVKLRDE